MEEAAWSNRATEWLSPSWGRNPLEKQMLNTSGKEKKNQTKEGEKKDWSLKKILKARKEKEWASGWAQHPKCSISPYWLLQSYCIARCRFHPLVDRRENSQRSRLHASPALIVNSVNEVILINFRAGSHMTFSSIFSPTSKTSISNWKMGKSEWRSLITPTYLKPRVNLFSGFECVHYNCFFKEDLQIAKKFNLSPRNVQKLFFPPRFLFFIIRLSPSPSGWTKPGVTARFLLLARTDHNSNRSWNCLF